MTKPFNEGPNEQRTKSLQLYTTRCWTDGEDHDWRYASWAPGWINGDDCAYCQKCERRAIKPFEAKNG